MNRATALNVADQLSAETPEAYDARREKWEGKHLIYYNAIQSTLGLNYYNNHKDITNAYFLWIALKEGCKPKGSGTLNNRYYRLFALKLSDYKDASEYARKFKVLYNDIYNMHEENRLCENVLIFLFHTSLRKEHEDYFQHYN